MKQKKNVESKLQLVFILYVNLLSGLIIACLSILLIYFKQKELLHHLVTLFTVFTLYFFGHIFFERIKSKLGFLSTTMLILIIMIGWLGPQFLYQIRPFTFYISGFAIGCVALVAFSGNMLIIGRSNNYRWNYLYFLGGYAIGFQIPPDVLIYLTLGLSVLLAVFYLAIERINLWFKASIIVALSIIFMVYGPFSSPLIFHKEQAEYEDKVVFTAETQYHQLVITQWHKDYWFYIDKLKNLSSIDEYLYYEPMVHGVYKIKPDIRNALVLGGENGCLVREILKHKNTERIDVISYDSLLRNLGIENIYFTAMSGGAFQHEKVHIIHEGPLDYLTRFSEKYDAIFMDLPDPRSVETNQYYTSEFYHLVKDFMYKEGVMITQAGSPYFATQAFYAIGQTIKSAGFNILPIHNQVLTLGEWGWYICSVSQDQGTMKEKILSSNEMDVSTRWFNQEAAFLITAFGKTYFDTLNVGINSIDNPLVHQYYLKGNWNLN